jgi:hypothetical protein
MSFKLDMGFCLDTIVEATSHKPQATGHRNSDKPQAASYKPEAENTAASNKQGHLRLAACCFWLVAVFLASGLLLVACGLLLYCSVICITAQPHTGM